MIANILLAPPLPFVPSELVGKPLVLAQLVHAGPLDAGERAVAPLRALTPPVADFVRAMPFSEMFPAEEQAPPPRSVVRTFFADTLSEDAARELLDRLQASTAQLAAAQVRVLGGAVARVPSEATAFAHRQRRLLVNVVAAYASPDGGSRSRAHGPRTPQPRCVKGRTPRTSTSSATRAPSGCARPIPARPGPARRREAPVRPRERVPAEPERASGSALSAPRGRPTGEARLAGGRG